MKQYLEWSEGINGAWPVGVIGLSVKRGDRYALQTGGINQEFDKDETGLVGVIIHGPSSQADSIATPRDRNELNSASSSSNSNRDGGWAKGCYLAPFFCL